MFYNQCVIEINEGMVLNFLRPKLLYFWSRLTKTTMVVDRILRPPIYRALSPVYSEG